MSTKSIDTNQVKRSVDCRDVAARYSELRKQSAAESAGPCPFCGGTNRFRVFADHWFCRPDSVGHCGRKGDTIALIMQRESVDFKRACEMLSNGALPIISTPAKPVKPVRKPNEWDGAKQLQKALDTHKALIAGKGKYTEQSRAYLSERGLTLETAQTFKLGYHGASLPNTWDEGKKVLCYPKQIAVLMPGLNRNGSLVAIKYRFLESHNYTDKDGEKRTENKTSRGNFAGHLFGWQAVKGPLQNAVLIITEGEINALSLWQAGDGLVDVLSTGTESMMKTLPDDMIVFAQQYQHRIVWADKGEIADNTALRIGAASMRSSNGQDANDLLKTGKLVKLLGAMLKKIGASLEAQQPAVVTEPPTPAQDITELDITDFIGATVDATTWAGLQAEVHRRYSGSWMLYADQNGDQWHVRQLQVRPNSFLGAAAARAVT
ncbi:hypothetical protein BH10CHL1_BH10CHL1_01640 [soil metagenome]